MIGRYIVKCSGCQELFVLRLGVEPTNGTRFYFPCPHCRFSIKGSMSGTELSKHRIRIDCELQEWVGGQVSDLPVITVNPFVPSLYGADSTMLVDSSCKVDASSVIGVFPNATLAGILGGSNFICFENERHRSLDVSRRLWPEVRLLFQYYLQNNTKMFVRIAKEKFGVDREPTMDHERTSIAYQAIGMATTTIVGSTGCSAGKVIERFGRKHAAAMKRSLEYIRVFRKRGKALVALERDMFTELDRFVEQHESWEMGLLSRFVGSVEIGEFERLVLYRDEFSILRDLYQQGFELACKCLWPLIASQNTVKRNDPNNFGDDHPASVPPKLRVNSLKQFDKLSNAYKIAYVAQVPGWESLGDLLDNRRRNAIGHASARHDLQTGRIVCDTDPIGATYLDFLGQTLGVFDALSTLMQVIRASRVAASLDFTEN